MARSREDKTLRSELVEARFAIQHQLELLRSPFSLRTGPPGNRAIIAKLQRQLKEIEEALADFDS
jgi:hypothetical protein